MTRPTTTVLHIATAMVLLSCTVFALEDELSAGSIPVENRIVDRDWALRLRGEMQLSDDDAGLIDEDPALLLFPAEMLTAELKLFHKSNFTLAGTVAQWQNDQDLNSTRLSVDLGVPIHGTWKVTLRVSDYDYDGLTDDISYRYLALGGMLAKNLYSYTQYRATETDGEDDGQQVSEHLGWTVSPRLRVGIQAAVSDEPDSDSGAPRYYKLFTTVFLFKKATSLRLEGMHYDHDDDSSFDEYKASLYQRIGDSLLMKASYRHHEEDDGIQSDSLGLKAKYYFSERFSAHTGYRVYDHSEDLDLNTMTAGFGLIL